MPTDAAIIKCAFIQLTSIHKTEKAILLNKPVSKNIV